MGKRFTPDCYITLRESRDGIRFGTPRKITANVKPKCHNMGVSGTAEGHINPKGQNFIAYAFTAPDDQGVDWHTFWQPIEIAIRDPLPSVPTARPE